jgi:hypothetical protein
MAMIQLISRCRVVERYLSGCAIEGPLVLPLRRLDSCRSMRTRGLCGGSSPLTTNLGIDRREFDRMADNLVLVDATGIRVR